jgi:hypothetical protein
MGNPCNAGPATAAPKDRITVTGNIPPAFREALENYRKISPNTEETEINFLSDQFWQNKKTPAHAKNIPAQAKNFWQDHQHIHGVKKETEKLAEQKSNERRHPDVVNWTKHGFHKLPPKPIDWDTPIMMGFGKHPFNDPAAVIPRTFRFTVETDIDSKFQYYVENMEVDWINKQIKMSLYENKEFDCDAVLAAYLSDKCDRPLTVMMYDGCGVKLMAYHFHGVALHTYSTPFDYASSAVHGPKVVFQYKSVERLKRPTK